MARNNAFIGSMVEPGERVATPYGRGIVTRKEPDSCYPVRVRMDDDEREVGCRFAEVRPLSAEELTLELEQLRERVARAEALPEQWLRFARYSSLEAVQLAIEECAAELTQALAPAREAQE